LERGRRKVGQFIQRILCAFTKIIYLATVKNIKIVRDIAKNSNYGFIEFESPETAKAIIEEFNGRQILHTGKSFKLNWASYSAGKQAAMSNVPISDYSVIINLTKVYVAELDTSVTEEILIDFFSKFYKSVTGSKIIIDPINKLSKGYGFVKFSDQLESQRALFEMNGKSLRGKFIRLK
jgi:RNA recognition motif-containing protein